MHLLLTLDWVLLYVHRYISNQGASIIFPSACIAKLGPKLYTILNEKTKNRITS